MANAMLSLIDPAILKNLWWQVLGAVLVMLATALTRYLIKLVNSKMETERQRRHAIEELAKITPQLLKIVTVFEQVALDAKSAKDLSRQQLDMTEKQGREISGLKSDFKSMKTEILDVETRMDRALVHLRRGDLLASKLAEEAEVRVTAKEQGNEA